MRLNGREFDSTLDPSAETFYVGPMRQPRERRGNGRCVRCMCELCRVDEGLSRREELGHKLSKVYFETQVKLTIVLRQHRTRIR